MWHSLNIAYPIIQAPMAGVSTPEMAATVSQAGALGSIAVGAVDATGAAAMIHEVRARTNKPFNVNLFVHSQARRNVAAEAAWLEALTPVFARFGSKPPSALKPPYISFAEDDDMLKVLCELAPPVVSFHFGLPRPDRISALKAAGCVLLCSVTSVSEAEAAAQAGIDMVVAQGFEAGGHRGLFEPDSPDECLSTMVLTRRLVVRGTLPVIAAGGIMDGKGVRAVLELGAVAAQLGTAFIACPESLADAAYRQVLAEGRPTTMTRLISGRPARCLQNGFTQLEGKLGASPPDYPVAYDAGKALNAAAKSAGEGGFGAQWAGQGASQYRVLPAAELIAFIAKEMQAPT